MRAPTLFIVCIVALFHVGCASLDAPKGEPRHTLAGNFLIPENEIGPLYEAERMADQRALDIWQSVRDLPYDAYVILRGPIRKDGSLSVSRIVASYPDDSRNELAQELARVLRLPSGSVGTHVKPTGEVYAIFYETHSSPNRAIVFGKRLAIAAPTSAYLGHIMFLIHEY